MAGRSAKDLCPWTACVVYGVFMSAVGNTAHTTFNLRKQCAPANQGAVDHVFAITELLEAILLQLDFSGKVFHTLDKLGEASQQPVVQLFALRRVSRMFQATIDGSRRRRGRMCLVQESQVLKLKIKWLGGGGNCFPCDNPVGTMYYAPLYWFLAHMRITRQTGKSCKGLTLNGPDLVEWRAPARSAATLHRKYASWRQIKTAGYTHAPGFKIYLFQVMASPSEVFQPGLEATLGDFYDNLVQKIAERREYDHMTRMEGYCNKYS
ncbi:hypothetical protein Slin14017_G052220 [Septoria linicola]|nr:hypothetical protein Slin14017_G052220 [Septoria linicola]